MGSPSRRDVLKGGAAAGVAAGLGLGSFSEILKTALAAPACGSLGDIEHVVIFIQENRSFDQYFGRYKGVRGFDDRSVRMSPADDGTAVFRQDSTGSIAGTPNPLLPFHLDTTVQLPPKVPPPQGDCTNDVAHQWADEHDMWNDGKLDRWVTHHVASDNPKYAPTTMGYYDGSPTRDGSGEMDFYWSLADNFTICDNYFCSVIGGTDANRLYSLTGTIDPDSFDGGLGFLDTSGSSTFLPSHSVGTNHRWIPYPELLDLHRNAAGAAAPVSWKVYGSPDQLSPVTDNVLRYFPQFRDPAGSLFQRAFLPTFATDFVADCLAGTLPQVSWIITDSVDSEHPPASVLFGQDTTHTIVTALMASPLWPKTAMILTYDENGGFFDHVPPPTPPPQPDPLAAGEYLDTTALQQPVNAQGKADAGKFASKPIGLGFRVPALVISPFSRNPNPAGGPLVCSDRFDHTSLLKLVERVFGVEVPSRDARARRPGLSPWRRDGRNIGDLTSAFNFAAGSSNGPVSLPLTSHGDRRSLTECPTTALSLGTGTFTEAYPIATPVRFPVQERFAGAVQRPSGVCAASTTTKAQPPLAPPRIARIASSGGTPNTSSGAPGPAIGAAVLATGLMAAGWWSRRRAEMGDRPPA